MWGRMLELEKRKKGENVKAQGSVHLFALTFQVEAKFHFSRVPVYQDTIDNIVGVMYSKSLLRYLEMPEKLDTTQVRAARQPG